MVFQDVVLFDDSIKENIRLGKRDATDLEVYKAAKAANCDEFVHKLPDGYDTLIGENGTKLSGGERQRISIARALLKDAPIILLDEATASLDVENETKVQEALSTLLANKTVLVIAHRMRTVQSADKIIVLENGRVKEEGAPESLYKQNGLYHHMVDLQSESSNGISTHFCKILIFYKSIKRLQRSLFFMVSSLAVLYVFPHQSYIPKHQ